MQQKLLDGGDIISAQKAKELVVPPGAMDLTDDDDKRKSSAKPEPINSALVIQKLDEFLNNQVRWSP